jgi:hypothetical protein
VSVFKCLTYHFRIILSCLFLKEGKIDEEQKKVKSGLTLKDLFSHLILCLLWRAKKVCVKIILSESHSNSSFNGHFLNFWLLRREVGFKIWRKNPLKIWIFCCLTWS